LSKDDVNKLVSVRVTGEKSGFQRVVVESSQGEVALGVQVLTPTPSITGTFQVGQTVQAYAGLWDPGVSLRYQWYRNEVPIFGADQIAYKLLPLDFAKSITVQVTGSIAGFMEARMTSPAAISSAGVMKVATPKISGTAKVGNTLKVVTVSWVSGAKIAYKWFANGVAIKGSTSSSLRITNSLKGKKIVVQVTQSASGFVTATKNSVSISVK
jgi:hypothetical protein